MNLKRTCLFLIASFTTVLFAGISMSATGESSSSEESSASESTTIEAGSSLSFSVDDMPDEIGGKDVLSEFLPDGISVEWTGKKLSVPKAGKVKYSKSDEDFVTTNEDNPCGLKLKVSKKGKVSGSFKVYVEKSEKKVKSYTAKVSGTLGGTLKVKISKVSGSFSASLD
jgi:hypothetical protein